MDKRLQAFLQALLVVALWSASPPLAKIAYQELDPVQVTAIRYCSAALVLLPLVWRRSRTPLSSLAKKEWLQLVVMGLLGFSLGNTSLYIGLDLLPATTTSFLLNGIPIATVILGFISLGEKPRFMQWIGILLGLLGGFVYFGWRVELGQARAVGLSLVGVLMIAIYGLLARHLTRQGRIDPVALSALPMGIGGAFLLGFIWPLPQLSWPTIGILAWLTVVNSAAAFVLWNHALQHMQAFEISITSNLMPVGTALLAPIFLGEAVPAVGWLGMLISLAGVVLVGLGGRSTGAKLRMV